MSSTWKCWRYLRWLYKFLAIAGTLTLSIKSTLAQSNIVPDNTLGTESSVVIPNVLGVPLELIDGGAIRGVNLFHSFREFNVSQGRTAYFISPDTIQNILVRVTGTNRSEILGTIGTIGNSSPNLFLMNPNGIIFGRNASLDIGGSFVATTANGIRLGDNGLFSASEPVSSNLLSVNPSALFFNSLVASQAKIINQSTATKTALGFFVNGLFYRRFDGLEVIEGKSLLFVGGDVSFDGGKAGVPGGRIELGGLRETGNVGINFNDSRLSLTFPNSVVRADISLNNQAELSVMGDGGSIAINARNLEIKERSEITNIQTVLSQELVTNDSQAGDISLNATGEIKLEDSKILNLVGEESSAIKGGNINIQAGSLSLTNSAEISTSTLGNIDAGNVAITARDTIDVNETSEISSSALSEGKGKGGNVTLNAEKISLSSNGKINVVTSGVGNAGSISLDANSVFLSKNAQISSSTFGSGSTGNIFLNTGLLSLIDAAQISTIAFDKGDTGEIIISARNNAILDGISSIKTEVFANEAFSRGGSIDFSAGSLSLKNGSQIGAVLGEGSIGDIKIQVNGDVSLDGVGKNGFASQISSIVNTQDKSFGGNITLNAGSLSLTNGGSINTSTLRNGNAGNIVIDVGNNTLLDGVGSNGIPTALTSDVFSNAIGNGGNLILRTGSLKVANGAEISTNTLGRGNAGNVTIDVRDNTFLDGVGSSGISTEISSKVFSRGIGNAGNLNLNIGSLFVANGAQILTETSGQGNSGYIKITSDNSISFDNVGENSYSSGLFSAVRAGSVGNSGNIDITSVNGALSLTNGAQVRTSTAGKGNAGNITVNTRNNQVSVIGSNKNGFSERIFINRNYDTNERFIDVGRQDGVSSGISSIVESTGQGNGGDIKLDVDNILLKDGGFITNDTLGVGSAGNIEINARNTVTFEGISQYGKYRTGAFSPRGIEGLTDQAFWDFDSALPFFRESGVFSFVEVGARGNGGNVTIFTNKLNLRENGWSENGLTVSGVGSIITATHGIGKAGDITITANDSISIDNFQNLLNGITSIVQPFAVGNGGNIEISAGSLKGGAIRTQTFGVPESIYKGNQGNAGNITIDVRDNASFNNSGSGVASVVQIQGKGKPGIITFSTGSLFLTNGAQIIVSVSPFGRGDGNNITVSARDAIVLDGSSGFAPRDGTPSGIYSSIQSGGVGQGANINLQADSIFISNNARVSAKVDDAVSQGFVLLPPIPAGNGDAGRIEVSSRELHLDNQAKITAESVNGKGGDIKLSVSELLLMRRNSEINAVSGVEGRDGVDGNIDIDALFLLAVPFEDSDIIATGRGRSVGSNVKVDSQGGIFGIEERQQDTPKSDIVATGITILNTPDVDPTRGTTPLPTDPELSKIPTVCQGTSTQADFKFTNTGRGGKPPSPSEPLSSNAGWQDLRSPASSQQDAINSTSNVNQSSFNQIEIVEAQGWYKNFNGEITLTSQPTAVTPYTPWYMPSGCVKHTETVNK